MLLEAFYVITKFNIVCFTQVFELGGYEIDKRLEKFVE